MKGKGKGKGLKGDKGVGKGFGAEWQKGKGKGDAKGSKGSGKGKGFQGNCFRCGKLGHTAAECWSTAVAEVDARTGDDYIASGPSLSGDGTIPPMGGCAQTAVGGVWMIAGVSITKKKGQKKRKKKEAAVMRRGFEDENKFGALAEEADEDEEELCGVCLSDGSDALVAQSCCGTWAQGCCAAEAQSDEAQVRDVCAVEVHQVDGGAQLTRQAAMDFNVADVRKPLASAVCVVRCGNRIVMDQDLESGKIGGYIENRSTGEKMAIREDNGTFVYDVKLDNGEVCAIILDSGAGCNVWPSSKVVKGAELRNKNDSLKMVAANGTPIANYGRQMVKFQGVKSTSGFRGPM